MFVHYLSASRRTILALMLIAGLLLSLAMPAVAATARPFKGSFQGVAGLAVPRCGSDVTLGFSAVGAVTHLGRIEGQASNCSSPSFPVAEVDVRDGIVLFAAADGSTITAAYSGVQQTPVAGVAAYSLTMTLVEGTGRFEGASGSWTTRGLLDFNTFTITGAFDGWIAY
jgi:hypothetical protein